MVREIVGPTSVVGLARRNSRDDMHGLPVSVYPYVNNIDGLSEVGVGIFFVEEVEARQTLGLFDQPTAHRRRLPHGRVAARAGNQAPWQ